MKNLAIMSVITIVFCSVFLLSCTSTTHREPQSMSPFKPMKSTNSILFIHGMYMTPTVWDKWQSWFQNHGYNTYAPAWPHHALSVAEQNEKHPDTELAQLTLDDVITHYEDLIQDLDEPPLIIGHSMGGLIAQKLLEKGITAGAVALNSAPPKGVLSFKFSFIKANLPHLNLLLSSSEPAQLSFKQFGYAFANDMAAEKQQDIYKNYMVPESRKVGRGPLGNDGKINPRTAREPLLIIAGGKDHIIPDSLNRSNFKKYRNSPSHTDFITFQNRNHLTVLQPGWENVAEYILQWVDEYSSLQITESDSAPDLCQRFKHHKVIRTHTHR